MPAWQEEKPPVSYIKLLMPYAQNLIVKSTASKYNQRLNPVFEKEVSMEKIPDERKNHGQQKGCRGGGAEDIRHIRP